ncbi:MAG: ferrous iron transport protein B [Rectinemataceae bacterium]
MGDGRKSLLVALAGNPNSGKTSLFNALTGAHHKVGNYPGVTVEKREGTIVHRDVELRIVDLPGIYSLTAYSLDEVVTRDFMLDEKPDIVIDVLDSTNLERNLYLCLQFQELGIPMVAALNMSDEAEAKGLHIDSGLLSSALGVPMVKTVGSAGKGTLALLDAVLDAAEREKSGKMPQYGAEIEGKLGPLQAALSRDAEFAATYPVRWFAVKLLERDSDAMKRLAAHREGPAVDALAGEARAWITRHFGKDSEIVMSEQRYGYIRGAAAEAVRKDPVDRARVTERIDAFLMHPLLGLPLFFLVMWSVFKLTFALGDLPTTWLQSLFGFLAQRASTVLPEGILRSLVVDGIIGGVGGVFSFVPLIVILFFCLSILEDTGYMARAAFLTDRFLHAVGLHGQSFMPMVLGFGCSVPAIMATRTLKSPRDRIATILAVPFMSCGAKLPVYVLLAGAFFPRNPGGVVMAVYIIGIVLSLVSTVFLRKTVLKGASTPFVMELPPYRLPTLRGILWHVWGKTWQYTRKAGTVILGASLLVWAITTFPVPSDLGARSAELAQTATAANPTATGTEISAAVERGLAEYRMGYSAAGRLGKFLEPAVAPLGFNWKIGVASITGFAAKELVVSTLGILYGAETTEAEHSEGLRQALRDDPGLSPLVAFTLMLFILVMPPCFAALGTIKSEAGWKWLGFQIAYSLTLAWVVAFAARNAGLLLGLA